MPPGKPSAAAAADRISVAADTWRRKLLDLGKRNRALNFRPAKVATVAIVDEKPTEVFRQLVLREQVMKFKAAPVPSDDDSSANSDVVADVPQSSMDALVSDDEIDADDEFGVVGADFAPYDPSQLDERHTDDYLQTASLPEALDKSLRRLEAQARISIEEQGVNTLFLALGMLHYRESQDSEQSFRAPLVLVPVVLERKSARSGYTIRAAEDEPLLNPALAEYLRGNFDIQLPELPDSNTMGEDYDLQSFFRTSTDLAAGKLGWSVKTDIFLALFSFQKFVMYKDLERNAPALLAHPLIRQLVTQQNSQRDGQIFGLPAEILDMKLDSEFPPERTAQVVDADSSQLRAIAAVSHAYDLVIEGPPGTGKSQTITNLIAQALSVGKSVLFVAEKMAALEVVHDRLVHAGLGEFCLPLHSAKANKRDVMKALASALDASMHSVAAPTQSTQRLPQVRTTLSEYVHAVHLPFGTLGISPFCAYGRLGLVYDAPRLKYSGPVDDDVTSAHLDQTLRDLKDLSATASEIGVPAHHPWRDTRGTFYSEDELEAVHTLAGGLAVRLGDVARRADAVCSELHLPTVQTMADVETAAVIAEVLHRSPGAPLAVLASDGWNQPPAEATALIERGREVQKLTALLSSQFTTDVLEQDHAQDIAYVERKAQGVFAFLSFLDGPHRAIRKRWMRYRLPAYRGSLIEQAGEMRQVDRLRAERQILAGATSKGQEFFGGLWQGERSRWDVLDEYVRWVTEFRGMCVKFGLSGRAIEVATQAAPDTSDVDAMRASARESLTVLEQLQSAVGWPAEYFDGVPIAEIAVRAQALADGINLGPRWAAFEGARSVVAGSLAGELLPAAMNGEVAASALAPAFLRAFYSRWLSDVVRLRPVLERFHTMTHEQRISEFRKLDELVLQENRGALIGTLRDRTQHALQQPIAAAGMSFLRRQMTRQRGLAPLRRTMQEAGPVVRAIKPCLMMSPLTVAQLLDGSAPGFDLVVFDEASQLPPEEAVGAIIRGRQLVVVGDPKQLPPTNFFAVNSGTINVEVGEDGESIYDDAESILEQYMGAGVPMSRLKWHYRSAHESLITFSNVEFYDSELYTFPSVERDTQTYGLQFEYIEGGTYEGKGLNAIEARHVADAVADFAREQFARVERGEPALSLGVGTFNLRQQLAIQDELEQRRREDPSIEPFFDRSSDEPFFVKNLENIQGDERDVIFISITYAKSVDGKLRYNFGPLNGENGWRRLNVLVTRARQQMRVFSSMRGDEINVAATPSRGAKLLREFLIYAERGRLESLSASAAADTESSFEADVLRELTNHGCQVVPQVGTAGYRIDLGVLDDVVPGRFVCGIECDGVAYHSSETARDRDRLRQQVLEARGWTIHRVWSTDWFKDRKGQIERLLRLIEASKVAAREGAETARQAAICVEAESERRRSAAPEAAADNGVRATGDTATSPVYKPPIAAAYRTVSGDGQFSGRDLLDAPVSQLVNGVTTVVQTESPIHETDLFTRVASMWGQRAGSRIQDRIRQAARSAERNGVIRRNGLFYWAGAADTCVVRSRANTRIPADRIAPEEYQQAVLAVLAGGHGFSRPHLTNEVRSMFGFNRTGAALEEAIGAAIDRLLVAGTLGEGSTGICLRR